MLPLACLQEGDIQSWRVMHSARDRRPVGLLSGYEFPVGVPKPGVELISTWAVASKPRQAVPVWLRHTLVWEASDPYLYLRTTRDGRLIVGGEDEASADAHEDRGKLGR